MLGEDGFRVAQHRLGLGRIQRPTRAGLESRGGRSTWCASGCYRSADGVVLGEKQTVQSRIGPANRRWAADEQRRRVSEMELDSDAIAEQVRWLVDREQIRDVLCRYVRGVDRVEPELIRSAYHEDSADEHGFVVVSGSQFADQRWRSSPLRGPSNHLLGEPFITLDGDAAYVETYFIAHQQHGRPMSEVITDPDRTDADGSHVSLFVGRYLDRFERRDGQWRISHRKVVMDLAEESTDRPVHPLADSFIRSERYPDDEIYHHLRP